VFLCAHVHICDCVGERGWVYKSLQNLLAVGFIFINLIKTITRFNYYQDPWNEIQYTIRSNQTVPENIPDMRLGKTTTAKARTKYAIQTREKLLTFFCGLNSRSIPQQKFL
jgi:hypothetical protein